MDGSVLKYHDVDVLDDVVHAVMKVYHDGPFDWDLPRVRAVDRLYIYR